MTPHEYVNEIERRFQSDEPRQAYALWLEQGSAQHEQDMTTDERRRLRRVLHILVQMASGLGWDAVGDTSTGTARQTA